MAASNSDFILEDVYVELIYKCKGKSDFHKILKPFTTPAAAHKVVMLDLPEHQLVDVKLSKAFEGWYYDTKIDERTTLLRKQWYQKVQDLLPPQSIAEYMDKQPIETAKVQFQKDRQTGAYVAASQASGTLSEAINSLDTEEHNKRKPPIKSYKEAFERSELKAIEKSIQEHPELFSANSKQHGGNHYKSLAIEPWDYITRNNIPYLEGTAIKYITRWKDKGGIEDIKKAIHFLEKLIEVQTNDTPPI